MSTSGIPLPEATLPFQERVGSWLLTCLGPAIAADRDERNHRFLEEALELFQSAGYTQSEAHQLVDYVFGRDVGRIGQEIGGVMVTLAALCFADDIDMMECAETELARIWTKIEEIRTKQAAKPRHSPLPEATPNRDGWSSSEKFRQLSEGYRNEHE
jgi:NTP pyrophosphatase (non-canonical NTP hydrolase)